MREKEERDQLKAVKAQEAAERKAESKHQKQAYNAQKVTRLPEIGTCKTSQSTGPRKKRWCGGAVARGQPVVCARSPTPQVIQSSCARKLFQKSIRRWQGNRIGLCCTTVEDLEIISIVCGSIALFLWPALRGRSGCSVTPCVRCT